MLESKIKAVVFDFDDTLYSHKTNEIPQSAKDALEQLKQNHFYLGLCTSRFPAEIKSFPKEMFEIFDFIVEGTGTILVAENQIIERNVIDPNTVKQLISFLEEQGIQYLWITKDLDEHFNMDPGERIRNHTIAWRGYMPSYQKWNGEELINITYYNCSEIQLKELSKFFHETKVQQWGNSGQINAKDIDKAYGLRKIAEYFQIQTKEIAAFGDGANDIAMIDEAGIGIAVGNSNDELQKHAYRISKPIEENGVYDMCVKLGFMNRKNGIRVLFFDIDGTTYQNDIHDLPKSTWSTLQQLKENGYTLFINTSRARQEMIQLPKEYLAMMDGIITNAGARIQYKGKDLYQYLNEEHTKKAIEYMEECGIIYRWVDDQGNCCLNRSDEDINQRFYRLYAMIPEAKKWHGEKLIHILYYSNDHEQVKHIEEIFSSEVSIHFGYGHEITPYKMNKATAMELVCKEYGYTLENAAAFGDGANDACMLEAAKIGVAMGNACDACKEVANYVTQEIQNDGLYQACKQFGWITK